MYRVSLPVNTNPLLVGNIKSLKLHPFLLFTCGYVNQAIPSSWKWLECLQVTYPALLYLWEMECKYNPGTQGRTRKLALPTHVAVRALSQHSGLLHRWLALCWYRTGPELAREMDKRKVPRQLQMSL